MRDSRVYGYCPSPLGEVLLLSDREALTGLFFREKHKYGPDLDERWIRDDDFFADVCQQLAEYFAGTRQVFDLELSLHGTPFQRHLWGALAEIPYGETWSYTELAEHIGRPKAVRAVGSANGRNPISIILPCHRVIGVDGSLTGYGGGLERKRALLELEARQG